MSSVQLGDICELKYGKSLPKKSREPGKFAVYGSNGQVDEHSKAYTEGPTIVVGRKGSIGEVAYSDGPCWPIDTTYYVDNSSTDQYPRWLFYALKNLRLQELNKSAAIPGLNRNDAYEKKIFLPPLEEQKRIAGILDQADTLRRLRTRALDKLDTLGQAIFHEMFGEEASVSIASKLQKIGDFCDVSSGSTPSRKEASYYDGAIPWVKTGEVNGRRIQETEESVSDEGMEAARLKLYPKGTVLIAMYGQGKTRGQVGILGLPATTNQACAALVPKEGILPEFLFYQLRSSYERLRDQGRGGNQPNLNAGMVKEFPIYVPDLERQAEFLNRVSLTEQHAKEHSASLLKLQMLFSSLQYRAFRGEL